GRWRLAARIATTCVATTCVATARVATARVATARVATARVRGALPGFHAVVPDSERVGRVVDLGAFCVCDHDGVVAWRHPELTRTRLPSATVHGHPRADGTVDGDHGDTAVAEFRQPIFSDFAGIGGVVWMGPARSVVDDILIGLDGGPALI